MRRIAVEDQATRPVADHDLHREVGAAWWNDQCFESEAAIGGPKSVGAAQEFGAIGGARATEWRRCHREARSTK
jgi:hypothetical protein